MSKQRDKAIACLKKHGKTSEDLDELVHECKVWEASDVNNEGFDSQVNFLMNQLGPGEVLARLDIPDEEISEVVGA